MSGLFGTGSRQQQQFQLDPQIQQQLTQAVQQLQGQQATFGQQAGAAAQGIQTQFQPFAPSQEADPLARRQAAQGQQAIQQQAATRARSIANQFRNAPGTSQILRQQAQTQSALQQNPLLLAATRDQQERDARQFQLNQASQQASNQALGQQLGIQALPLQQQQGLIQLLSQLGQQTGTQTASGRSGGLFV